MQQDYWDGPKLLLSKTGKYRVELHSTVVYREVNYHCASICEQIRSYWQPVKAGSNILDSELEYYLTQ